MRHRALVALFALFTTLPAFAFELSGWIPAWDKAALESLQLHGAILDESNPVWYTLEADGSIDKVWNAENPSWRAAMSGSRLLPTIQNYGNGGFDDERVTRIISDPVLRARHIEDLVVLVVQNAYDGIDIDYERIPASSRDDFSAFVTELARELHATGKLLSVTVHPKTSASQDWRGPGGQDWPVIGAAADSVKIMAYDYHWSTSTAGALSPLSWVTDVARYATNSIPASKVVMGLPWYGYDWLGNRGTAVTWKQATALAKSNNVTPVRDADGELTFSYDGRTVFFQDAESYRLKINAILKVAPGIGGITQWRLGDEDAASWNVIRDLRGETVIVAAPAPEFELRGLRTARLSSGSSLSLEYEVERLNSFDDPVNVKITSTSPVVDARLARTLLHPGERTVLTLTAVEAGSGSIRLQFESEGVRRYLDLAVTVEADPLQLSIEGPSSVRLKNGEATTLPYRVITNRKPSSRQLSVTIASPEAFDIATSEDGSLVNTQVHARQAKPGRYALTVRVEAEGVIREMVTFVEIENTRRRGTRR
ncbi:MAG: hypothetical protein KY459_08695 [Acidobacteria bacterium]|nr:hypothetical protein [Acidobacteriota bacterium]